MGYDILGTIFGRDRDYQNTRTGQFGFFPCAPGCQGSPSNPRFCRCVCRGVNHGCLISGQQRPIRPIMVTPGAYALSETPAYPQLPQQPLALPAPDPNPVMEQAHYERVGSIVARKAGRLFLKSIGKQSRGMEQDRNQKIMQGLRYQFAQNRVDQIIDQAFSLRMQKDPYQNQPELYELLETGEIDRACELSGSRWVLGRPKSGRR